MRKLGGFPSSVFLSCPKPSSVPRPSLVLSRDGEEVRTFPTSVFPGNLLKFLQFSSVFLSFPKRGPGVPMVRRWRYVIDISVRPNRMDNHGNLRKSDEDPQFPLRMSSVVSFG